MPQASATLEGLISGFGTSMAANAGHLDAKMQQLVEAPAAIEDALASLLNHHDSVLQVRHDGTYRPASVRNDRYLGASEHGRRFAK